MDVNMLVVTENKLFFILLFINVWFLFNLKKNNFDHFTSFHRKGVQYTLEKIDPSSTQNLFAK
jgi:hypothetical protein